MKNESKDKLLHGRKPLNSAEFKWAINTAPYCRFILESAYSKKNKLTFISFRFKRGSRLEEFTSTKVMTSLAAQGPCITLAIMSRRTALMWLDLFFMAKSRLIFDAKTELNIWWISPSIAWRYFLRSFATRIRINWRHSMTKKAWKDNQEICFLIK